MSEMSKIVLAVLGITVVSASFAQAVAEPGAFGAYTPRPGAPSKLFIVPERAPEPAKDICKVCLGPAKPDVPKPKICQMILCMEPAANMVTAPITSSLPTQTTFEFCKNTPALTPYCKPFAGNASPSFDATGAYKGWLEMGRISTDMLRKSGELDAKAHNDFLRAYREDWNKLVPGLQGSK